MSRLLSSRAVLVTVVLAACQAAVVANAQTPGAPAAAARQVITSAEQLPRRVIKLDKLPSQYLEAPRAEVLALAAVLEKNLRDDLDRQIKSRIIEDLMVDLAPTLSLEGTIGTSISRAVNTYVAWIVAHPRLHQFAGRRSTRSGAIRGMWRGRRLRMPA